MTALDTTTTVIAAHAPPRGELIGISETATQLGVSYKTVRQWILRGQLPAWLMGKKFLVRKSDVDAFIAPFKPGADKAG